MTNPSTDPVGHAVAQPLVNGGAATSRHQVAEQISLDVGFRHYWSASSSSLHSLPCCWPHVSSSSRQIMVCLSPSRSAASIDSMPRKRMLMRLASRSDLSDRPSTEGGVGEGVPSGRRKVPVSNLLPSLPVSRAGGKSVRTSGGARGFDGRSDGNVSTFLCGPRSFAVGGGGAKGLILSSASARSRRRTWQAWAGQPVSRQGGSQ